MFVRRRPTDDELERWYADYPVMETISPITVTRLDQLIASFERFRVRGTILDVGAGSGHLLNAAARAEWTPHAVEYGETLRGLLRERGFTVHAPLTEGATIESGSFDVVTVDGVIEHMRDPRDELDAAIKLLRPGGLLYITAPNFDSISRYLLGDRWPVIEYPEHLNYFSPRTLPTFIERLGMETIHVSSSGFSFDRARKAVARRSLVDQPQIDERIRSAAERVGLINAVKQNADRTLSRLGVGETLKARFARPLR